MVVSSAPALQASTVCFSSSLYSNFAAPPVPQVTVVCNCLDIILWVQCQTGAELLVTDADGLKSAFQKNELRMDLIFRPAVDIGLNGRGWCFGLWVHCSLNSQREVKSGLTFEILDYIHIHAGGIPSASFPGCVFGTRQIRAFFREKSADFSPICLVPKSDPGNDADGASCLL